MHERTEGCGKPCRNQRNAGEESVVSIYNLSTEKPCDVIAAGLILVYNKMLKYTVLYQGHIMKEKKQANSFAENNFMMENSRMMPDNPLEKKVEKPGLLLHSCCGPCSTSVIERLAGEFNITLFFYNPCITDENEYKRRRDSQIKFIEKFNQERMDLADIRFMEGPYEPGEFFELTGGHEHDSEGGARCAICFRQRLEKTAQNAAIAGCDFFGTTLTVSPHKNYEIISGIGREIALKYNLSFLDRDFKKQDGFRRSIEMSKKYALYRQNYCGCEYSKR